VLSCMRSFRNAARSAANQNERLGADEGRGQVRRWVVSGLPAGEPADITECAGVWCIQRVRQGMLENDPRGFPTPEAAFAALVEEYRGKV